MVLKRNSNPTVLQRERDFICIVSIRISIDRYNALGSRERAMQNLIEDLHRILPH